MPSSSAFLIYLDGFSLLTVALAATFTLIYFTAYRKTLYEALTSSATSAAAGGKSAELGAAAGDDMAMAAVLKPAGGASDDAAALAKARHNRAYKIGGGVLVLMGFGGFLPSLIKLCIYGKVWSVSDDRPHTDVDVWLVIHMVGAVGWALTVVQQLISGGVASRRMWHRVAGWVAFTCVTIGVVACGGFIWTIIHDFYEKPVAAAAGAYTFVLGIGTFVNMALSIVYARRKQFAEHKDHALMAMMWSMDPGVHRSFMWTLHAVGGATYGPATFANRADNFGALAKMPANVVLVFWCLCMATSARRLNRITVLNASGQFTLWVLGVGSALAADVNSTVAAGIGATLAFLWVLALVIGFGVYWKHRRRAITEGSEALLR